MSNNNGVRYSFTAAPWMHKGPGGWHFVSLPQAMSAEIRKTFKSEEEGWGRLKVTAQLGKSEWVTAVWFDTKMNTYVLPLKKEIREKEQVSSMELIDLAVKTYGKLDVAVNNAGISGEINSIVDMSIEGWQKVIAINLSSLFYGMKYQIQAMLKNGGGSIVNISSILGSVGFAGSSGYSAAKHGVIGLTKTGALEYAAQNIRINAIGPGFVDTPILEALEDEMRQQLISLHPIGRLGKSEEIAEMILWLSSDKSSFVNGSYVPIDGGYLAK